MQRRDRKMVVAVVTGASGYVAGHVIQQLISKGYTVKGSVRSLADDGKVGHLRALFPALELFEADLLVDGSFDAAVAGADVVFHTASPFIRVVADPQRDLVDPAVLGTLNVLRSVHRGGCRRWGDCARWWCAGLSPPAAAQRHGTPTHDIAVVQWWCCCRRVLACWVRPLWLAA